MHVSGLCIHFFTFLYRRIPFHRHHFWEDLFSSTTAPIFQVCGGCFESCLVRNGTEIVGPVIVSCVFGSYDPSLDSSEFMELALPTVCVPCTWTLGLLDTIFTVAEKFGTDWISVWSLNGFLTRPDQNQVSCCSFQRRVSPKKNLYLFLQAGISIYFAHPYKLGVV